MAPIKMAWFRGRNNCGDILGPLLARYITGQEPEYVVANENHVFDHYFTVGSMITRSKSNTIIWGSGVLKPGPLLIKPKKICAVRGPTSRQYLISHKVACPEVYGDPALLMPRFFKPKVAVQYELGIIPHYVDKLNGRLREVGKDTLVIDVQRHPEKVITDILKCKNIASSSLHGVILADAYGIPSLWLTLSDKVLGAQFKFDDYFQSIGSAYVEYVVGKKLDTADILEKCRRRPIKLDLDLLLESCPFRRRNDRQV